MPQPQNYANHTRFDPPWHYFIAPATLVNLLVAIVATVRAWPDHSLLYLWWIVMSIVLILAVARARMHAMVVQDRVIRLEEQLRYALVLSREQLLEAESLTLRQIIALRFASNAELPSLVHRAVAESLTPKQIKQAIAEWRSDLLRV
jgi:hypothetical protein